MYLRSEESEKLVENVIEELPEVSLDNIVELLDTVISEAIEFGFDDSELLAESAAYEFENELSEIEVLSEAEEGEKTESVQTQVEKIKQEAHEPITRLASEFKRGKIKGAVSKVSSIIKQAIKKLFSINGIAKGVLLTYVVIVINSVLGLVLTNMLGDKGGKILIIFVGPLVEETMKHVSIKMDATAGAALVFNAAEFNMYYKSLTSMGADKGRTAKLRGSTVVMHLATTMIQSKSQKYAIKKEEEGTPEAKKKARMVKVLGFALAFIIHALWNALGIKYNDKAIAYVFKHEE
jgi:PrsW family intramembrane metalloprotease